MATGPASLGQNLAMEMELVEENPESEMFDGLAC